MAEESNTNITPPTIEPSTPPAPLEPIVAPVAPAEPVQTPPVDTPEPIAPPTPALAPQPPPDPLLSKGGGTDFRSLLSKALAKIRFRKQANPPIRRADATASRYLSELVKTGRLQRTGVRGGAVYHLAQ